MSVINRYEEMPVQSLEDKVKKGEFKDYDSSKRHELFNTLSGLFTEHDLFFKKMLAKNKLKRASTTNVTVMSMVMEDDRDKTKTINQESSQNRDTITSKEVISKKELLNFEQFMNIDSSNIEWDNIDRYFKHLLEVIQYYMNNSSSSTLSYILEPFFDDLYHNIEQLYSHFDVLAHHEMLLCTPTFKNTETITLKKMNKKRNMPMPDKNLSVDFTVPLYTEKMLDFLAIGEDFDIGKGEMDDSLGVNTHNGNNPNIYPNFQTVPYLSDNSGYIARNVYGGAYMVTRCGPEMHPYMRDRLSPANNLVSATPHDLAHMAITNTVGSIIKLFNHKELFPVYFNITGQYPWSVYLGKIPDAHTDATTAVRINQLQVGRYEREYLNNYSRYRQDAPAHVFNQRYVSIRRPGGGDPLPAPELFTEITLPYRSNATIVAALGGNRMREYIVPREGPAQPSRFNDGNSSLPVAALGDYVEHEATRLQNEPIVNRDYLMNAPFDLLAFGRELASYQQPGGGVMTYDPSKLYISSTSPARDNYTELSSGTVIIDSLGNWQNTALPLTSIRALGLPGVPGLPYETYDDGVVWSTIDKAYYFIVSKEQLLDFENVPFISFLRTPSDIYKEYYSDYGITDHERLNDKSLEIITSGPIVMKRNFSLYPALSSLNINPNDKRKLRDIHKEITQNVIRKADTSTRKKKIEKTINNIVIDIQSSLDVMNGCLSYIENEKTEKNIYLYNDLKNIYNNGFLYSNSIRNLEIIPQWSEFGEVITIASDEEDNHHIKSESIMTHLYSCYLKILIYHVLTFIKEKYGINKQNIDNSRETYKKWTREAIIQSEIGDYIIFQGLKQSQTNVKPSDREDYIHDSDIIHPRDNGLFSLNNFDTQTYFSVMNPTDIEGKNKRKNIYEPDFSKGKLNDEYDEFYEREKEKAGNRLTSYYTNNEHPVKAFFYEIVRKVYAKDKLNIVSDEVIIGAAQPNVSAGVKKYENSNVSKTCYINFLDSFRLKYTEISKPNLKINDIEQGAIQNRWPGPLPQQVRNMIALKNTSEITKPRNKGNCLGDTAPQSVQQRDAFFQNYYDHDGDTFETGAANYTPGHMRSHKTDGQYINDVMGWEEDQQGRKTKINNGYHLIDAINTRRRGLLLHVDFRNRKDSDKKYYVADKRSGADIDNQFDRLDTIKCGTPNIRNTSLPSDAIGDAMRSDTVQGGGLPPTKSDNLSRYTYCMLRGGDTEFPGIQAPAYKIKDLIYDFEQIIETSGNEKVCKHWSLDDIFLSFIDNETKQTENTDTLNDIYNIQTYLNNFKQEIDPQDKYLDGNKKQWAEKKMEMYSPLINTSTKKSTFRFDYHPAAAANQCDAGIRDPRMPDSSPPTQYFKDQLDALFANSDIDVPPNATPQERDILYQDVFRKRTSLELWNWNSINHRDKDETELDLLRYKYMCHDIGFLNPTHLLSGDDSEKLAPDDTHHGQTIKTISYNNELFTRELFHYTLGKDYELITILEDDKQGSVGVNFIQYPQVYNLANSVVSPESFFHFNQFQKNTLQETQKIGNLNKSQKISASAILKLFAPISKIDIVQDEEYVTSDPYFINKKEYQNPLPAGFSSSQYSYSFVKKVHNRKKLNVCNFHNKIKAILNFIDDNEDNSPDEGKQVQLLPKHIPYVDFDRLFKVFDLPTDLQNTKDLLGKISSFTDKLLTGDIVVFDDPDNPNPDSYLGTNNPNPPRGPTISDRISELERDMTIAVIDSRESVGVSREALETAIVAERQSEYALETSRESLRRAATAEGLADAAHNFAHAFSDHMENRMRGYETDITEVLTRFGNILQDLQVQTQEIGAREEDTRQQLVAHIRETQNRFADFEQQFYQFEEHYNRQLQRIDESAAAADMMARARDRERRSETELLTEHIQGIRVRITMQASAIDSLKGSRRNMMEQLGTVRNDIDRLDTAQGALDQRVQDVTTGHAYDQQRLREAENRLTALSTRQDASEEMVADLQLRLTSSGTLMRRLTLEQARLTRNIERLQEGTDSRIRNLIQSNEQEMHLLDQKINQVGDHAAGEIRELRGELNEEIQTVQTTAREELEEAKTEFDQFIAQLRARVDDQEQEDVRLSRVQEQLQLQVNQNKQDIEQEVARVAAETVRLESEKEDKTTVQNIEARVIQSEQDITALGNRIADEITRVQTDTQDRLQREIENMEQRLLVLQARVDANFADFRVDIQTVNEQVTANERNILQLRQAQQNTRNTLQGLVTDTATGIRGELAQRLQEFQQSMDLSDAERRAELERINRAHEQASQVVDGRLATMERELLQRITGLEAARDVSRRELSEVARQYQELNVLLEDRTVNLNSRADAIEHTLGEARQESTGQNQQLREELREEIAGLRNRVDTNTAHQDDLRNDMDDRLRRMAEQNDEKLDTLVNQAKFEIRSEMIDRLRAGLDKNKQEFEGRMTQMNTELTRLLGDKADKSDTASIGARLEDFIGDISASQAELRGDTARLERLGRNAFKDMEKQLRVTATRAQNYTDTETASLKGQIDDLVRTNKTLETVLAQHRAMSDDELSQIRAHLTTQIEQLGSRVDTEVATDRETLMQQLKDLRDEQTNQIEQKTVSLQRQMAELTHRTDRTKQALEARLDVLEHTGGKLTSEQEELRAQIHSVSGELATKKTEMEAQNERRYQELQESFKTLGTDIEQRLTGSMNEMREDIARNSANYDKLNASFENIDQRLNEFDGRLDTYQTEISTRVIELERVSTELREEFTRRIQESIGSARTEWMGDIERITSSRIELLVEELSGLKRKLQSLVQGSESNQDLTAQIQEDIVRLNGLTQDLQTETQRLEDFKVDKTALDERLEALNTRFMEDISDLHDSNTGHQWEMSTQIKEIQDKLTEHAESLGGAEGGPEGGLKDQLNSLAEKLETLSRGTMDRFDQTAEEFNTKLRQAISDSEIRTTQAFDHKMNTTITELADKMISLEEKYSKDYSELNESKLEMTDQISDLENRADGFELSLGLYYTFLQGFELEGDETLQQYIDKKLDSLRSETDQKQFELSGTLCDIRSDLQGRIQSLETNMQERQDIEAQLVKRTEMEQIIKELKGKVAGLEEDMQGYEWLTQFMGDLQSKMEHLSHKMEDNCNQSVAENKQLKADLNAQMSAMAAQIDSISHDKSALTEQTAKMEVYESILQGTSDTDKKGILKRLSDDQTKHGKEIETLNAHLKTCQELIERETKERRQGEERIQARTIEEVAAINQTHINRGCLDQLQDMQRQLMQHTSDMDTFRSDIEQLVRETYTGLMGTIDTIFTKIVEDHTNKIDNIEKHLSTNLQGVSDSVRSHMEQLEELKREYSSFKDQSETKNKSEMAAMMSNIQEVEVNFKQLAEEIRLEMTGIQVDLQGIEWLHEEQQRQGVSIQGLKETSQMVELLAGDSAELKGKVAGLEEDVEIGGTWLREEQERQGELMERSMERSMEDVHERLGKLDALEHTLEAQSRDKDIQLRHINERIVAAQASVNTAQSAASAAAAAAARCERVVVQMDEDKMKEILLSLIRETDDVQEVLGEYVETHLDEHKRDIERRVREMQVKSAVSGECQQRIESIEGDISLIREQYEKQLKDCKGQISEMEKRLSEKIDTAQALLEQRDERDQEERTKELIRELTMGLQDEISGIKDDMLEYEWLSDEQQQMKASIEALGVTSQMVELLEVDSQEHRERIADLEQDMQGYEWLTPMVHQHQEKIAELKLIEADMRAEHARNRDYLMAEIQQKSENYSKTEAKLKKTTSAMAKLSEKVDEMKDTTMEEIKDEIESLKSDLTTNLSREQEALQLKQKELESKIADLETKSQERKEEYESDKEKLQQELSQLKRRMDETETRLLELTDHIASITARFEQNQTEMKEKLEETVKNMEATIKELQDMLVTKQALIDQVTEKERINSEAYKTEMARILDEISFEIEMRGETLSRGLQDLYVERKEELDRVVSEHELYRTELEQTQTRVGAVEEKVGAVEKKVGKTQTRVAAVEAKEIELDRVVRRNIRGVDEKFHEYRELAERGQLNCERLMQQIKDEQTTMQATIVDIRGDLANETSARTDELLKRSKAVSQRFAKLDKGIEQVVTQQLTQQQNIEDKMQDAARQYYASMEELGTELRTELEGVQKTGEQKSDEIETRIMLIIDQLFQSFEDSQKLTEEVKAEVEDKIAELQVADGTSGEVIAQLIASITSGPQLVTYLTKLSEQILSYDLSSMFKAKFIEAIERMMVNRQFNDEELRQIRAIITRLRHDPPPQGSQDALLERVPIGTPAVRVGGSTRQRSSQGSQESPPPLNRTGPPRPTASAVGLPTPSRPVPRASQQKSHFDPSTASGGSGLFDDQAKRAQMLVSSSTGSQAGTGMRYEDFYDGQEVIHHESGNIAKIIAKRGGQIRVSFDGGDAGITFTKWFSPGELRKVERTGGASGPQTELREPAASASPAETERRHAAAAAPAVPARRPQAVPPRPSAGQAEEEATRSEQMRRDRTTAQKDQKRRKALEQEQQEQHPLLQQQQQQQQQQPYQQQQQQGQRRQPDDGRGGGGRGGRGRGGHGGRGQGGRGQGRRQGGGYLELKGDLIYNPRGNIEKKKTLKKKFKNRRQEGGLRLNPRENIEKKKTLKKKIKKRRQRGGASTVTRANVANYKMFLEATKSLMGGKENSKEYLINLRKLIDNLRLYIYHTKFHAEKSVRVTNDSAYLFDDNSDKTYVNVILNDKSLRNVRSNVDDLNKTLEEDYETFVSAFEKLDPYLNGKIALTEYKTLLKKQKTLKTETDMSSTVNRKVRKEITREVSLKINDFVTRFIELFKNKKHTFYLPVNDSLIQTLNKILQSLSSSSLKTDKLFKIDDFGEDYESVKDGIIRGVSTKEKPDIVHDELMSYYSETVEKIKSGDYTKSNVKNQLVMKMNRELNQKKITPLFTDISKYIDMGWEPFRGVSWWFTYSLLTLLTNNQGDNFKGEWPDEYLDSQYGPINVRYSDDHIQDRDILFPVMSSTFISYGNDNNPLITEALQALKWGSSEKNGEICGFYFTAAMFHATGQNVTVNIPAGYQSVYSQHKLQIHNKLKEILKNCFETRTNAGEQGFVKTDSYKDVKDWGKSCFFDIRGYNYLRKDDGDYVETEHMFDANMGDMYDTEDENEDEMYGGAYQRGEARSQDAPALAPRHSARGSAPTAASPAAPKVLYNPEPQDEQSRHAAGGGDGGGYRGGERGHPTPPQGWGPGNIRAAQRAAAAEHRMAADEARGSPTKRLRLGSMPKWPRHPRDLFLPALRHLQDQFEISGNVENSQDPNNIIDHARRRLKLGPSEGSMAEQVNEVFLRLYGTGYEEYLSSAADTYLSGSEQGQDSGRMDLGGQDYLPEYDQSDSSSESDQEQHHRPRYASSYESDLSSGTDPSLSPSTLGTPNRRSPRRSPRRRRSSDRSRGDGLAVSPSFGLPFSPASTVRQKDYHEVLRDIDPGDWFYEGGVEKWRKSNERREFVDVQPRDGDTVSNYKKHTYYHREEYMFTNLRIKRDNDEELDRSSAMNFFTGYGIPISRLSNKDPKGITEMLIYLGYLYCGDEKQVELADKYLEMVIECILGPKDNTKISEYFTNLYSESKLYFPDGSVDKFQTIAGAPEMMMVKSVDNLYKGQQSLIEGFKSDMEILFRDKKEKAEKEIEQNKKVKEVDDRNEFTLLEESDRALITNILNSGDKNQTSLLSLIYYSDSVLRNDEIMLRLREIIEEYCTDTKCIWRPDIDPLKFLSYLLENRLGDSAAIREDMDRIRSSKNYGVISEYIFKYLQTLPYSNHYTQKLKINEENKYYTLYDAFGLSKPGDMGGKTFLDTNLKIRLDTEGLIDFTDTEQNIGYSPKYINEIMLTRDKSFKDSSYIVYNDEQNPFYELIRIRYTISQFADKYFKENNRYKEYTKIVETLKKKNSKIGLSLADKIKTVASFPSVSTSLEDMGPILSAFMRAGLSTQYAKLMNKRGYFENAEDLLRIINYPLQSTGVQGGGGEKGGINYKPLERIAEDVGLKSYDQKRKFLSAVKILIKDYEKTTKQEQENKKLDEDTKKNELKLKEEMKKKLDETRKKNELLDKKREEEMKKKEEEKKVKKENENKTLKELAKKLDDKMVTKEEVKKSLTSLNPKKKLLKLLNKKDVDEVVDEIVEKNQLPKENKEKLKGIIKRAKDLNIPISKITSTLENDEAIEDLEKEIKKREDLNDNIKEAKRNNLSSDIINEALESDDPKKTLNETIENKKISNVVKEAKSANVPISDIKEALLSENPVKKLKDAIVSKDLDNSSLKDLVKLSVNRGVPISKVKEIVKGKDPKEGLKEEIKKKDLDSKNEAELVDICKKNNISIDDIEEAVSSGNSVSALKGLLKEKGDLENKSFPELKDIALKKNISEDTIYGTENNKDKLIEVIDNKIREEHPSDSKLKENLRKLPVNKIKKIAKSNNVSSKDIEDIDEIKDNKTDMKEKITDKVKEKILENPEKSDNRTEEEKNRDNEHKDSLIDLIINKRKKVKPHKYVSKPIYNEKDELVQYIFYPKEVELSDDYKSDDIIYLETELLDVLDQIKEKENKIDKLSRDKLLYNKTKNDILDFAKEKIYQDLENNKKQLYKLKKEKQARENMIKLMKIYMNEQQRRNKEKIKESGEYLKLEKEKEIEKIRKIHKDMQELLTEKRKDKLENETRKNELEMKKRLDEYKKEIEYYRNMNDKLLKMKEKKHTRTLKKEKEKKEKRTNKKKKERKNKRTNKKKNK